MLSNEDEKDLKCETCGCVKDIHYFITDENRESENRYDKIRNSGCISCADEAVRKTKKWINTKCKKFERDIFGAEVLKIRNEKK